MEKQQPMAGNLIRKSKPTDMKKVTLLSRVLATAGLAVLCFHFLQKKESRDPVLFYIACGLVGLAWILAALSYAVNRNRKELREFLLFTGLIAAGYLAFYFS